MSEKPKSIARGLPATSITLTVTRGKVTSRVVQNERTAEEWARLAQLYPDKPLRRPPPRGTSHEG